MKHDIRHSYTYHPSISQLAPVCHRDIKVPWSYTLETKGYIFIFNFF